MSIPLPPLPEHLHHPELQKLDAFTREQLRARDQEIVRVVLEAATQAAELWYANGIEIEIAREIRALEFHHE